MQKPEVVILHGWAISPENKAKWQTFRDALRGVGVASRFLAIPGFDTPISKPWQLTDYVQWLAQELPEKNPVILLGHSFGGQLALRFSTTYPQKVRSLVLIASAGIRDYSARARIKRALFLVLAKVGKVFLRHDFFKKVLYKLAGEHDYEQATLHMKETMKNVTQDEIRDDLQKVNCPVQLIWGKLDTSTPYKNTDLFLEKLPAADLCTITDARHSPQFTHPEQTASCVAEFITERS